MSSPQHKQKKSLLDVTNYRGERDDVIYGSMLHCISILPKLECLVRTPDLKRQFRLISPSNRKLSPNLLVILSLWRIHSSLKQNKYSVRRRYFCTFEHIQSKQPLLQPWYTLYIYLGTCFTNSCIFIQVPAIPTPIYLSRCLLYLLLYIYLGACYT